MFRRLAEAFQDDNNNVNGNKKSHSQYTQQQNTYFNALPNIIPSATSGLKGFSSAIQTISPQINKVHAPIVPFADDVFMAQKSAKLEQLSKKCESSSLDDLIASQNPNAKIGCGWMYTPPSNGSPYPQLSRGFIGDVNGPFTSYNPPASYGKWFYDLKAAKKQMLLDKCKSLSNCGDVDQSIYSGVCGYCTDTNQGVPIDGNGNPLYPDSNIGNCSPTSIVTSGNSCPMPAPAVGPIPSINGVCDPVGGRLSAMCLYNTVTSGGCSNQGALALALGNSPPPNDYVNAIRDGESVKIYNRVAKPPLNLDIFKNGQTSVSAALQEVRQLAANANTNPSQSALGASARDLCLQSGALSAYDFCGDLPDSTAPPYNVQCLQKLFMKMGGQPAGTAYPSQQTISNYNTIPTLGGVKMYWGKIITNLKSSDYETQRKALMEFLGITPEKMVKRAPWYGGVEVMWFWNNPSYNGPPGLIRRTIESDIPQFPVGDQNIIPQINMVQYSSFYALTDVRAQSDFSVKFNVTVDDGFWMAMNQAPDIDYYAAQNPSEDGVGFFASNQVQGPTTYQSNACSILTAKFPNMYKFYYQDRGGGGHTLQINTSACTGQNYLNSKFYSLTCEQRAPFINLEVNPNTMNFEDTRLPGAFAPLIGTSSLEYHTRSEEMNNVPGKKAFVRMNNSNSSIYLTNVSYQAWGTMSACIRLQSMPIKDSLFAFWTYNTYCHIYLQPISSSKAQIYISTVMTNDGTTKTIPTQFQLDLNKWYYIGVSINSSSTGMDISCDSVENIITNKGSVSKVSVNGSTPIYLQNNFFVPGVYSSSINVGGSVAGFNMANAAFIYDLAWLHFFDHYASADDIYRECMTNWVFTQFPSSLNNYTSN